jgi:hypothetical protein
LLLFDLQGDDDDEEEEALFQDYEVQFVVSEFLRDK